MKQVQEQASHKVIRFYLAGHEEKAFLQLSTKQQALLQSTKPCL